MRDPKTIIITGASSGIGEALALHYARPEVVLALSGRDEARLRDIAARCNERGAATLPSVMNVTDQDAMAAWITGIAKDRRLDLVVANAGISAGTGKGEGPEQIRRIYDINVGGVMNTILPAIEVMQTQAPHDIDDKRGQIAIMSALASFRGFPGAPAYCASKATVRIHGEALRGELHHQGIEVSVICPGYVRSRMTARNKFRMPMLMDADHAAQIIARGLARNKARIAFPWPMYWLVRLIAGLPQFATDPLFRKLPKKD